MTTCTESFGTLTSGVVSKNASSPAVVSWARITVELVPMESISLSHSFLHSARPAPHGVARYLRDPLVVLRLNQ